MSIAQLINLLAAITVIEMMLTIGLGVKPADVLAVARNWRLVGLAALVNYIAVPAIALALLLLLDASPMVAAGFLVAAVCPGAPYGPPLTVLARGKVILAVGLMVILAGSSAIMAPLLLQILLPLIAGDTPISVNGAKILSTLLLVQLLPMCVGLYVRQRHPALADRLLKPLTALSKIFNLTLVTIVLAVQFPMLAEIRLKGYIGMLALVAGSALAGWLVGSDADTRKTLAITTSVRNVGVSLVIATASFAGTPAIAATTAYALFQTLTMALVASAWGKLASSHGLPAEQARPL